MKLAIFALIGLFCVSVQAQESGVIILFGKNASPAIVGLCGNLKGGKKYEIVSLAGGDKRMPLESVVKNLEEKAVKRITVVPFFETETEELRWAKYYLGVVLNPPCYKGGQKNFVSADDEQNCRGQDLQRIKTKTPIMFSCGFGCGYPETALKELAQKADKAVNGANPLAKPGALVITSFGLSQDRRNLEKSLNGLADYFRKEAKVKSAEVCALDTVREDGAQCRKKMFALNKAGKRAVLVSVYTGVENAEKMINKIFGEDFFEYLGNVNFTAKDLGAFVKRRLSGGFRQDNKFQRGFSQGVL